MAGTSRGFGRRALGGAFATGLSQGFRILVQFATLIVLSRLLGPATFGLMAMLTPILAFVTLFSDLGLSNATITAHRISPAQMTTLFWVNVAVAAVLAAAVAAAAPLVARFYGEAALVWPLVALAGSILLAGLGAQHKALANRELRFQSLAAVEMLSLTAGFAVSVTIALVRPSIWALVCGTLATALVASMGQWVRSGWLPRRPAPWREVREMVRFGRGMVGFNLANLVSRTADNVMIGAVAGPAQLGLYDRAYKLLLFPLNQINWPVGRVVIPILSKLVDQPARYREAYLKTIRQLLLVTMPGVAFLLSSAYDTIPLVLGPQWAGSAPIFLWLGLAAVHQPLSATLGWLFISQSRTDAFARWGAVGALTSLAAFAIGLPWGAMGVAAAYGVSDLLVRAPIVWWWVGRQGPVATHHLLRLAFPNAVALLVTLGLSLAAAGALAGAAPLVRIGVQLPLCFAAYWACVALWPQGRATFGDAIALLRNRTAGAAA